MAQAFLSRYTSAFYHRIRMYRATIFPKLVVLPTFLIIGAAKAGTTSLYYYLSQHPGVAPALKKEIGFFSHWYKRGWPFYLSFFPFNSANKDMISGEASPSYMLYPHCARLAYHHLPNAKIIAILRNPVDRAYSQFQQTQNLQRDPLNTFEECIDSEQSRVQGDIERALSDPNFNSYNLDQFTYLTRGHYFEQLQKWGNLYSKDRLLVLGAEEFYAQTREVMGKVHAFLGIDKHELSKYEPQDLKSPGRNYGPMKPETRQRLIDYFRPHNKRLYDFTGRTFDWDK